MTAYVETIFCKTARPILQHLAGSLEPFLKSKSHSLLFSLSPALSLPPRELSDLVSAFSGASSTIGCLSSPVLLSQAGGHSTEYTACSVAVFDRQTATVFHSSIPGREEVQVGRWHAYRKRGQEESGGRSSFNERIDWKNVWQQNASVPALPPGLDGMRYDCIRTRWEKCTLIFRPEDVESVLYFSDNAPEGLVNSLTYFSQATKVCPSLP